MRLLIESGVIAILGCTGCSGAPFELAPSLEAPLEGGLDPLGEAAAQGVQGDVSRPQALLDQGAGQDHDAGLDEGVSLDAKLEAEGTPSCTPISTATIASGACPFGPPRAIAPDEFAVVMGSGCPAAITPDACKWCKETYTCACILAYANLRSACQTSSFTGTCSDSSGTPTVTCQ